MANIPLPGLDALGWSYDIFGKYADVDSIRLQLFELGPNDTSQTIEGSQRSYWRPSIVGFQRQNKAYLVVALGNSSLEYQRDLTVAANLSGGFGAFSASVSSTFTQSELQRSENSFCSIRNVVKYYALHLRSPQEMRGKLLPAARLALDTMEPQQLFRTWGTHYLGSLVAGAWSHFSVATNRMQWSSTQSLDVSAQAAYAAFLSAKVDVSSKESVTRLRSSSTMRVRSVGGDPLLGVSQTANAEVDGGWTSYPQWLASVPTNLVFSDFVDEGSSLVPLWDLVVDARRRQALIDGFARFVAQQTPPPRATATPDLEYRVISQLVRAADDRRLGSSQDLTTYLPQLPDGFYFVGQHAQGNYGAPTGSSIVVKDQSKDKTALRPPTGFTRVWDDHGSLDHDSYSCWRPDPPPGYVALGHLFKHAGNYHPPSTDGLMCVRADLATRAALGRAIWSDAGSGASKDLTLYEINPIDGTDGVPAHTFFGFPASKAKAPGIQEVYCLRTPTAPMASTAPASTPARRNLHRLLFNVPG